MTYTNFNYNVPNDYSYFKTLIGWLKKMGEKDIVNLLKDGRCTIQSSGQYSQKRWNAYYTTIYFYIPVDKIELVNDEINKKLIEFCDEIIPRENGLDVMEIEFAPLIDVSNTAETLTENLENTIGILSSEITKEFLPHDIREKGKEMTEVYLYLYVVENALRLFIEKTAKSKFGDDYFTQLKINREIRDKISNRKNEEQKNKWVRVRGNSEVFYLDFKDLSSLIQNNWDLFSSYFPDQNWISIKINELANCRNLVAHNSIVEDHEKDVIKVNFNSILRQLDTTFRD